MYDVCKIGGRKMNKELKCPSCKQKDREIADLKAGLDNIRHFCESILNMARRNNGVLYFRQNGNTWEIETGKSDDTDNNVGSMEEEK
jgi:hypothetical protein